MAAPTNAVQKLQKILANGEPSTHGLLCRSTYCGGNESLGKVLITAAALSVLALISDANFL